MELNCKFDVKRLTEAGEIEGYGSVFNNLDLGNDIVAPGAFSASLKANPQPKMLWQHDVRDPIGVWKNVSEDKHGLHMVGQLVTTSTKGRDAYELVKAGALDGLSIGYRTKKSQWDEDKEVRTLLEVELWEVSLVTFAMNPAARLTDVKSLPGSIREFEEFLRDAGFSRAQAKAIASRGYKSAGEPRDEVAELAALRALITRNTTILKPT